MLAIQPRSIGSTKEELTTVGVGTSIGHGQDTYTKATKHETVNKKQWTSYQDHIAILFLHAWTSVLQSEVLIFKLVAIDGLSTSAVVVGEVTSLAHELGDDTVESGSLVAETTLTGAESTEVLSSARHHIGTELGKEKKRCQA